MLNPADIQPICRKAAEAESHFDADTLYSETDMPRDTTYFPTADSRSGENTRPWLRPVESSAAVWNAALREYRVARIDRLPMRARMLDILEQMDRGHLLALMGTTLPVVWLDGQHDIALLAGVLFCYGYIEIAGRHHDNAGIVYFGLSAAGRRKLREGRDWWNTLSFWQRLKVRAFG